MLLVCANVDILAASIINSHSTSCTCITGWFHRLHGGRCLFCGRNEINPTLHQQYIQNTYAEKDEYKNTQSLQDHHAPDEPIANVLEFADVGLLRPKLCVFHQWIAPCKIEWNVQRTLVCSMHSHLISTSKSAPDLAQGIRWLAVSQCGMCTSARLSQNECIGHVRASVGAVGTPHSCAWMEHMHF